MPETARALVSNLKPEGAEPDSGVDWMTVIANVKSGDAKGMEDLHRLLDPGIRFYLVRRMKIEHIEEGARETFATLTSAIRSEGIREQEPLMELVRKIVGRQAAEYSDQESLNWNHPGLHGQGVVPSDSKIPRSQSIDQMIKVLKSLPPRAREALTRFYFGQQPQEKICLEMQVSLADFVLWKVGLKTSYYENVEGQSWI